VRKWTLSACVALAWSTLIVPLLAVAGLTVSGHPTQARPGSVSVTETARVSPASPPAAVRPAAAQPGQPAATWTVRPGDTLSGIAAALAVPGGWRALYIPNEQAIGPNPNKIRPGIILELPQREPSARYKVTPGDTLSSIAIALAVPGGWQALYAANRQAIGPDPNLIRPGVVLMSPRMPSPASSQTPSRISPETSPRVSSRPPAPRPRHQGPGPATSATAAAPAGNGGGMPRWLREVLLVVGVLAATAFAGEPVAARSRRSRAVYRPAGSAGQSGNSSRARYAVARARIILADHERLIVTYSSQDDTVYVLTPPGEDPRAVLRAARLILPENTYEDLADHLGVPAAWPLE
jgi:LysM repeat protein